MFARGLRQLFSEGRRYAVAASALTAGVALLFGTLLTSLSVGATLSAGVDALGGIGQAGIVSSTPGAAMPEEDAAAVAELPGVGLAVTTLSRGSSVEGAGGSRSDLTITGYSTDLNEAISRLASQGRLPREGSDEVLVPSDIAERLGVSVGDDLALAATTGRRVLKVVGIADPRSLGVLAYENIFVSLPTAQEIFDLPAQVTRVDLTFDGSADEWKARNAAKLPHGLVLQDTSAVTSAFGPLLSTITLVLVLASVVTMGVAAILIAVALGAAIRARDTTYAVMRTVGASGGWLGRRVLAEATTLSVLCSVVGIGAGFGMSAVLNLLLTASNGLPLPTLEVHPWQIGIAFTTGLVAGLAGASRSIVSVVRRPPIATITHDHGGRMPAWSRFAVVAGLLAPTVATLFVDHDALTIAALVGLLAASMFVAPVALRMLARMPWLPTWSAEASARRLQRTNPLGMIAAMTASIACLGLALVIGVSAISTAMVMQISRQFGADVQVSSTVPLDAHATARIAGVSGVSIVSGTIADLATFTGPDGETAAISVLGVDPATYFRTAQLPWNAGDDHTTPASLETSGGIVLPAALAASSGAGVGSVVTLTRGTASERLAVVGTFDSLVTGTQVVVPLATARALGMAGQTGWNVSIAEGAHPLEVRDAVADELSDVPGLTVITAAAMRERATSELGAYSGSAFAVVLIAFGLGSIGIAGVMAFSVHQRRAEFGALRAVGATRRGVAGLVLWDAIAVSLASLAVGLCLGQLAGALLTRVIAGSLGVSLTPVFEPGAWLAIAVVTVVFLVTASIGPARRASAVDPVVALAAQ